MKGSCPFCGTVFDAGQPAVVRTCPSCRNEVRVFTVEPPQFAPVIAAPSVPVPAAGGDPVQAPPCARHPGNAAVTACTRCGDFVCNVCATPVEGTVLCVRCFEFKHTQGELVAQKSGFGAPKTSLMLGILSVLCMGFCWLGIVFGPGAIITGVSAVRQIRRQPGLPGEKLAVAGIVLGSLGTLACLVFFTWAIAKN